MEKKNGVVETHYGNGQIEEIKTYKDGNLDGLREFWYGNGELETRETYEDGKWLFDMGGNWANVEQCITDKFEEYGNKG